jgi:CubicO group peptidase (beta-lactamase class C family)
VPVARGDDLVTCRGFGRADHEAGTASTCDTVYDIGSITKSVTGTAIVKLESMGKLAITDPVSAHLGPVPADKRGITLHHLLTHTSGLPDSLGDDYDPLSRAELIDAALRAPVTPGGGYRYSNLGYSLLAVVVEVASGTSYEEFLAEHLFRPAGMTSTGYVLPERDPARVAVEYDEHGEPQGRPYEHPWAPDGPHWNLRGNGGLLSTPRDMFRWHVALLGDTILDEDAKARLFAPRVRVPVDGYDDIHTGYGWSVLPADDGPAVAHTGGNGWSFATYARFLDSGTMVFFVSNHAVRHGEWNLEDQFFDLTMGLAAAAGR